MEQNNKKQINFQNWKLDQRGLLIYTILFCFALNYVLISAVNTNRPISPK